jgi:2'-5' RNA ligase
VLPVPEAEPIVGRWRDAHDRWAALGMPAHVTVLGPLLPLARVDDAVLARIDDVVSAFPAFRLSFTAVRRLPGVVFLAPEPIEPLRALTKALERALPEAPRYGRLGGRLAIYHLTVARGLASRRLREIRAELEGRLPFDAEVDEVVIFAAGADGRVEPLRRFALAGR